MCVEEEDYPLKGNCVVIQGGLFVLRHILDDGWNAYDDKCQKCEVDGPFYCIVTTNHEP